MKLKMPVLVKQPNIKKGYSGTCIARYTLTTAKLRQIVATTTLPRMVFMLSLA
jgi:hypothetical protein